jgi:hypothetical protein
MLEVKLIVNGKGIGNIRIVNLFDTKNPRDVANYRVFATDGEHEVSFRILDYPRREGPFRLAEKACREASRLLNRMKENGQTQQI